MLCIIKGAAINIAGVTFHLLSPAEGVKVLWPDLLSEHYIIVEVEEILGQSRYAVDVALNGWRAVRRKVRLVDKNVLFEREGGGREREREREREDYYYTCI